MSTKRPKAPTDLSQAAMKEWTRITSLLGDVLTEVDQAILTIYCVSYAQFREAQRKIDSEGTIITNVQGNQVKNPHLSVQRDAWDKIKVILGELGLSPAARSKLMGDDDDDGDEPLKF